MWKQEPLLWVEEVVVQQDMEGGLVVDVSTSPHFFSMMVTSLHWVWESKESSLQYRWMGKWFSWLPLVGIMIATMVVMGTVEEVAMMVISMGVLEGKMALMEKMPHLGKGDKVLDFVLES